VQQVQKTDEHTQCNAVADQHMSPHSQCPGLRALQGRKELEKLVKRVKNTRDQMQWGPRGPPPLLIKIAPDLTDADKSDVARFVSGWVLMGWLPAIPPSHDLELLLIILLAQR